MEETVPRKDGAAMTPEGGHCSKCGAVIKWIVMKDSKKRMPLEARPLTIVTDDGEVVRGRESHFAHCPHAQSFRRDR